jgi:hypothetical protein
MARRIVLTMLALVSALLIIAVAPLGVVTAGREQDSFRMQTLMSAHALAGLAEKRLDSHAADPALTKALAIRRGDGDEAWVYDTHRQLVAYTSEAGGRVLPVPPGTGAAVTTVLRGGDAASSEAGGRLRVVVASMGSNDASPDGAVVLSRSTRELHSRLHMLWAWLSAVAAIGLLGAAIAAVMLARWVGRPLSALDAAAQQLGSGALDTRSGTGHGPPEVRRCALRSPRSGCGWTCSPRTPTRPPPRSWLPRRARSSGCPAWWTACWRSRGRRTWYPGRWRSPSTR